MPARSKSAAATKASPKPAAKKKAATARKKTAASAKKKTVATKTTAKKAATKKKPAARKATARKVTAKKAATKKKTNGKAAAAPRRSTASPPIAEFGAYQPGRDEDYMSDEQLEHFRQILTAWKRELMEEVDRTVHHMKDEAANFPDPNDRATQESEFGLELRTRDRERKLIRKIDSALQRIDDGSYGYCEETGEEIGLRRLEARPVATLTVEAQERREMAERQYSDRDER